MYIENNKYTLHGNGHCYDSEEENLPNLVFPKKWDFTILFLFLKRHLANPRWKLTRTVFLGHSEVELDFDCTRQTFPFTELIVYQYSLV